MSTVITSVDTGSPALRAGITTGEKLVSINGHEPGAGHHGAGAAGDH